MILRAIAVCGGLIIGAPAVAQTAATPTEPPATAPTSPPTEQENPRYSFHRAEDGYLRLDTRTGQAALCSRRQVGWACQVLPDDRTVLEAEIARLQQENGALKKELLSRGIALPRGTRPPTPETKAPDRAKSPESEINRVMTMVETVWRRLVEMIGNLQRDMMKKG
jgi:hypothetical protein